MSKVKVIDSVMGSGKTSWAIQYMNENVDKKFIYITPFLSEVERVKESCYMRLFKEPDVQKGKGRKVNHFNQLIKNGNNIVSTHALFRHVTQETLALLKEQNYTLILDEVMNVIERIKIEKTDFRMLKNEKLISIDEETKRIHWHSEYEEEGGKYSGEMAKLKKAIVNGDCYASSRSKRDLLIWTFPVKVFDSFKESYIMTYLFDGQYQRYYYDMNNVKYTYHSIKKINDTYKLVDYKSENGLRYKHLINICDNERLNKIGNPIGRSQTLSSSWFKKSITNKSDSIDVLKKNISNYFIKSCDSKVKDIMWTTYKEYKSKVKGKGYTKGFIPCTCRATNEYKDKLNLAYCINLFMNPIEKGFFTDRGVSNINEDMWALAEMLQWIWRSRIRENNNINIYIPSLRMRTLLEKWLDDDLETYYL